MPKNRELGPEQKIDSQVLTLSDIIYNNISRGDNETASFWLDVAYLLHNQQSIRLTHQLQVSGLAGSYPKVIVIAGEMMNYLSWKADESRRLKGSEKEYVWTDLNEAHSTAIDFIFRRGEFLDKDRKKEFNKWLYTSDVIELRRILKVCWPLEKAITHCYDIQGLHNLEWIRKTHKAMTETIFNRFLEINDTEVK